MSAASLISIVYLDLGDVLQGLRYSRQILRGLCELISKTKQYFNGTDAY